MIGAGAVQSGVSNALHAAEQAARDDAGRVAAINGDVFCSNKVVCRAAGKPFAVDEFKMEELVATGKMTEPSCHRVQQQRPDHGERAGYFPFQAVARPAQTRFVTTLKVPLARAIRAPSAVTKHWTKQRLLPSLMISGSNATHWPILADAMKSTPKLAVISRV